MSTTKVWAVYNFDILWNTFRRRKDAIAYAESAITGGRSELRKLRKTGCIRIVKALVVEKEWTGSWYSKVKP